MDPRQSGGIGPGGNGAAERADSGRGDDRGALRLSRRLGMGDVYLRPGVRHQPGARGRGGCGRAPRRTTTSCRVRGEALAAGAPRVPNIVQVFGLDDPTGQHVIYVYGVCRYRAPRSCANRNLPPVDEGRSPSFLSCRAVDHAPRAWCDVSAQKPGNLMRSDEGGQVADSGSRSDQQSRSPRSLGARTAAHLAPEQAAAKEAARRPTSNALGWSPTRAGRLRTRPQPLTEPASKSSGRCRPQRPHELNGRPRAGPRGRSRDGARRARASPAPSRWARRCARRRGVLSPPGADEGTAATETRARPRATELRGSRGTPRRAQAQAGRAPGAGPAARAGPAETPAAAARRPTSRAPASAAPRLLRRLIRALLRS